MSFTTYLPAFVTGTSVIPAAYLNRLRVDIGRAIDGTGGGDYTPASVINVTGSGFGEIDVATKLETLVGGQNVAPLGAQIADINNSTFTLAQGQIREFAANGGARVHEVSVAGATDGSWIHFIGLPGNVGNIAINRAGSGFAGGVDVVTLPLGNWSCATLYYEAASTWRLLRCSALAVPGPNA